MWQMDLRTTPTRQKRRAFIMKQILPYFLIKANNFTLNRQKIALPGTWQKNMSSKRLGRKGAVHYFLLRLKGPGKLY
jgi:hypothetical protein